MNKLLPLFILLLGAPGIASAAFKDVPSSHPNYVAINYAQQAGIVSGNPDGTYRPNEPITRAAFTKIIIGAQFDINQIDTCWGNNPPQFLDVTFEDWFGKYVCEAALNLIINGYSNNTFRPGNTINMAEASKIIALSFNLQLGAGTQWYEQYVNALVAINAMPATLRQPDQPVTRGEMAEMIYRIDTQNEQQANSETRVEVEVQAEAGVYTEFSGDVIGNGETSVLFFYAAWCPHCQKADQSLHEWYQVDQFPVSVYQVDFDTASALKSQYGVVQQHTFVKIDGSGNAIETISFPSDQKLAEFLVE